MPVQAVAAHQIPSSAQAALSAGIQIVPATDPAAALARIAASPVRFFSSNFISKY